MDLTLEGLATFAKEFVATLPQRPGASALVVGLKGDLGAGKTAFVQAVAREMGVKESVTSPTFVIAQSYQTMQSGIQKVGPHGCVPAIA